MHVERTVVVARPAEVIFDFLADGPSCSRWRDNVGDIELMTNSAGLGAVYRQTMTGPGGYDIDCDYLITGYDPPRLLEFSVVAGPVRPTGRFELAEHGGQTQVTFGLDTAGHGLRRLTVPLFARALRREVAQLDRLKAALEGDRSAV